MGSGGKSSCGGATDSDSCCCASITVPQPHQRFTEDPAPHQHILRIRADHCSRAASSCCARRRTLGRGRALPWYNGGDEEASPVVSPPPSRKRIPYRPPKTFQVAFFCSSNMRPCSLELKSSKPSGPASAASTEAEAGTTDW